MDLETWEKNNPNPSYEEIDDVLGDLMHGMNNLFGRNDKWLTKRISHLEKIENRTTKEQQELENKRVEMGFTRSGKKKPKTCWAFVKQGHCHHNVSPAKDGFVHGQNWHPGFEEAAYLKQKVQ